MTRAERERRAAARNAREVARMRRHREELAIAFANGWPLERARAEMTALRRRALAEARRRWRGETVTPAPEPTEAPQFWWIDQ